MGHCLIAWRDEIHRVGKNPGRYERQSHFAFRGQTVLWPTNNTRRGSCVVEQGGDVVHVLGADSDTGDTRREESRIRRLEVWTICRGRVRARGRGSRHRILRRDASRRTQRSGGEKQFSEADFEKATSHLTNR
jgi:hypothetical protein